MSSPSPHPQEQKEHQEAAATTSSSTSTTTGCPYAQALQTDSNSSCSSLPGLVELKECPAFSKECPFKNAKSAEEVSQRLSEIPASHLDANGTFYKTLEFFHRSTSPTNMAAAGVGNGEAALLCAGVGSCPVKHSLQVDWSFDQAMEEYSSAALMGKLAQAWEDTAATAMPTTTTSTTASTNISSEASPSTLTPTAVATPRLSDALKSGTAIAHEAAESVHFVKNFIRGQIDRDLYGLLVAQLYYVYDRLEQALDDYAPQHFESCHFPKELRRIETLKEDMDFWHTSTPAISPATQDYMDRIDHLSHTNPLLLLAHAYTRYMGDLSGGKVLSRVARRALQLQDDGLAFYAFEHVKSFKLFKDHYRTCLNELPLSEAQIQDLVQEANVAFLLNMRLFEELDVLGGVPNASIRPLEAVYAAPRITFPAPTNDSTASKGSAPCPFAKGSTMTATEDHSLTNSKSGSSSGCPWPFVLMHDPKKGFQAWQTWVVLGLALVFVYQSILV